MTLTKNTQIQNNCDKCKTKLPINGKFVTCLHCKSKFHFSPCCSLTEKAYAEMSNLNKENWKCTTCKQNKVVNYFHDPQPQIQNKNPLKKGRENDESLESNSKKFCPSGEEGLKNVSQLIKDEMNEMKSVFKSELDEFRTDMHEQDVPRNIYQSIERSRKPNCSGI